jgi:hypothetical protein
MIQDKLVNFIFNVPDCLTIRLWQGTKDSNCGASCLGGWNELKPNECALVLRHELLIYVETVWSVPPGVRFPNPNTRSCVW